MFLLLSGNWDAIFMDTMNLPVDCRQRQTGCYLVPVVNESIALHFVCNVRLINDNLVTNFDTHDNIHSCAGP